MSEGEIKVGDWVQFKSSGFKNEGKVTKDEGESFQVEIPSDGSGIYVSVPKNSRMKKIDPPAGS